MFGEVWKHLSAYSYWILMLLSIVQIRATKKTPVMAPSNLILLHAYYHTGLYMKILYLSSVKYYSLCSEAAKKTETK